MPTHSFMGTGVALITPFTKDLSVDYESLESIVHHVIRGGVDYLVVMGTTGEPPVLSFAEKKSILQKILEANAGRVPVVLGIGGNDTTGVCEAIRQTDFSGIQGVLSVVPYYTRPNQNGLFQHFSEIARQSPLPVIVYNVPARTGSNLLPETVLHLTRQHKNIVAVKEASGNLSQMTEIIQGAPEHFSLISGDDALILPSVAMGGSGVISVAANAFPERISGITREALHGNFSKARSMHYAMEDLLKTLFCEGNPMGIKALMEILGFSQNVFRLPLTPVSGPTYQKLKELAEKLKS